MHFSPAHRDAPSPLANALSGLVQRRVVEVESLPQRRVVLSAVLMMVFAATFDWLTGHQTRVLPFYFVPLVLMSWRVTLEQSLLAAGGCTLLWLAAHAFSQGYTIHEVVWAWNTLVVFASLAFVALTTGIVRLLADDLRTMALHDGLTGIYNRRAFRSVLETEVARAHRHGHTLTLLYLDIDDFKRVNDQHGHEMGDEALRTMGRILLGRLRTSDSPARLGGDEFAILLPETDEASARKVAGVLTEALRAEQTRLGFPISCSLGAATFAPAPERAEEVLHHADELMYEVKRGGKGAISSRTFQPAKAPRPDAP
ncbi:MAG: GGDEF domain-containing protein [Candidatus Sumerlaeia bacterium]|nr:GGDEF domain-containing protein [Candidatus Sumerlaeia bacterium]